MLNLDILADNLIFSISFAFSSNNRKILSSPILLSGLRPSRRIAIMAAAGNAAKSAGKLATLFNEFLKSTTNFESALKTGRVVLVEPGKVHYEIEIAKEQCNPSGHMHGAFAALIVDNLTGAAIMASGKQLRPDNPLFSGVSVNMTMSYPRPAKLGETILAKAEVTKIGRNLAFTTCEISRKSDGKVVTTGQHTKFVG